MFKTHFEVILVDHFVLISVEEVKQLKNLLVHVLVLDNADSIQNYMEIMARNSDSYTWLQF
jgi:hypothetical protein